MNESKLKTHFPVYLRLVAYIFFLIIAVASLRYNFFGVFKIIHLFFAYVLILIFPGYAFYGLIQNKIQIKLEWLERYIFYFIFSLLLAVPFVYISYAFKSNVSLLIYEIVIISAVIALLDIFLSFRQKQFAPSDFIKGAYSIIRQSIKKNLNSAFYLLLALLAMMVAYKVGSHIGSDAQIHIAVIRKMIDFGISPKNPFIKEFGALPIYTYNLWYPIMAVLSALAKVDIIYAWLTLPVFIVPLIVFSVYFLAKSLVNDNRYAAICAFLFVYFLIYAGLVWGNGRDIRTIIYQRNIDLFILLPIYFGLFLRYISSRIIFSQKFDLVLIGLLGFLVLAIHPFYFMLLAFSVGFFAAVVWIRKYIKKSLPPIIIKSLITAISATLIISLPFLVFIVISGIGAREIVEAHNMIDQRSDVIVLFGRWHIAYPSFFYPGKVLWGMVSWVSPVAYIVLTPIIYIYYRKTTVGLFLFSLMIITPILTLLPFVSDTLGNFIGLPKVARIYQIAPIFYLVSFFIWDFLAKDALLSKGRFYKIYAPIFVIVLALLLNGFSAYSFALKKHYLAKQKQILAEKNALVISLRDLPKGSVVLSDYKNSRLVPYVSSNYIINFSNLSGFWGNKLNTRREDQTNLLAQEISDSNSLRLIKKYQIDYILVNRSNNKFQKYGFKVIYTDKSKELLKVD